MPRRRTPKSHRVPASPRSGHHTESEEAQCPGQPLLPTQVRGALAPGTRCGSRRGCRVETGEAASLLGHSDPRSLPRTRTAASWAPCSQRGDESPTGTRGLPTELCARRPRGPGLSRPPLSRNLHRRDTEQGPLRCGPKGSPRTAPSAEWGRSQSTPCSWSLMTGDVPGAKGQGRQPAAAPWRGFRG